MFPFNDWPFGRLQSTPLSGIDESMADGRQSVAVEIPAPPATKSLVEADPVQRFFNSPANIERRRRRIILF